MAIVGMSIGGWMLLGLKAGCALAIALVISDTVRGFLASILESIYKFDKPERR